MRVARFVLAPTVATLFLVLLVWPGAARADASPAPSDSMVASPGVPADSLLTIHPVKGDSIQVRFVEPWGIGVIRYRTASGEIGYLATNKVRTIEDSTGKKRQDEVISGRKRLGSREDRSLGAWLLGSGRFVPDRERRNYFVAEFGFSSRINDVPPGRAAESVVQTGFGWMANLSKNWALGGVLEVASDMGDYHFGGAGVRLRRYLGDVWSVEGTAGVFDAAYGVQSNGHGIPLFGEVGFTALGSLTLFTRIERHSYSYRRYISFFPAIALGDAEVSDDVLRIGVRMGPRPRLVAIPLAVAGSMLVMSGNSRKLY